VYIYGFIDDKQQSYAIMNVKKETPKVQARCPLLDNLCEKKEKES